MFLAVFLSIGLTVLALVLHIFGLYLLRKAKCSASGFTEIQRFYLLHLSIVELVLICSTIPNYFYHTSQGTIKTLLDVFGSLSLFTWNVGIMQLITLDRFLMVYLNIKYSLFWTMRKSKIAVYTLIITSLATMGFVFLFDGISVLVICVVYIWPCLDATFLLAAFTTYTYFFKKIRENMKLRECYNNNTSAERNNKAKIAANERTDKKMKRGFFTPTLLIVSFILFVVIPDQVFFWYFISSELPSSNIELLLVCCYQFSWIVDAVIYIFFQREIFREVKKIFRRRRIQDQPQSSSIFTVPSVSAKTFKSNTMEE